MPLIAAFEKLYKLHGTKAKSFVIGPSKHRKSVSSWWREEKRELEIIKRDHRLLDAEISSLDVPCIAASMQWKIQKLKKDKLRLKDRMNYLLQKAEEGISNAPIVTLGEGGFGKILLAECVTSGVKVAVKVAHPEDYSSLSTEFSALKRLTGSPGFPRVLYIGQQELPQISTTSRASGLTKEKKLSKISTVSSFQSISSGLKALDTSTDCLEKHQHSPDLEFEEASASGSRSDPVALLVMELLGPSLDRLLYETRLGTGGLSSLTVLNLASQMLLRLQSLASCRIVHGDIQPGNMLMGKDDPGKQRTVHLIDFGLSRRAKRQRDGSHIFRAHSQITGLDGDQQPLQNCCMGRQAGSAVEGGPLNHTAVLKSTAPRPAASSSSTTCSPTSSSSSTSHSPAGNRYLAAGMADTCHDAIGGVHDVQDKGGHSSSSSYPQMIPHSGEHADVRLKEVMPLLTSTCHGTKESTPNADSAAIRSDSSATPSRAAALNGHGKVALAAVAADCTGNSLNSFSRTSSSSSRHNKVAGPVDRISGTLEFSSRGVLRGKPPQYKDDLESLAYCLAYLLVGSLPWSSFCTSAVGDHDGPSVAENHNGMTREASSVAENHNGSIPEASPSRWGKATSNQYRSRMMGGGDESACMVDEEGMLEHGREAERVGGVAEAVAELKDRCILQGSICCGRSAESCRTTSVIMDMLAHARTLPELGVPDYVMLIKACEHAMILEAPSYDGGHDYILCDATHASDFTFDWENEGVTWSSVDGGLRLESYSAIAAHQVRR
ncbi:hypothetical protein CEUSTIGMA_g5372.t1 [Chlamydomonas eustigma]|uniref:Protein kinase domain-containing protein n=1 Tax=Chlamydomonas eustigma TaxID=1157962 RepID=A0A250X592_9CHLO|nr:hypothetical protein CEUSTIGMA_g5372.t1 [Chlamydomonas eustigma]|eukprot:GAX77930.1 hypothetical protein CEUSTIGMA_g5372.t1 [Chlamydomonas eustigma]